jgi:hypothetical protein
LPFAITGFVSAAEPGKSLLSEPVKITTKYVWRDCGLRQVNMFLFRQVPGIVPRSYAPPGYERPAEGDYNAAVGYLENGNQRFCMVVFSRGDSSLTNPQIITTALRRAFNPTDYSIWDNLFEVYHQKYESLYLPTWLIRASERHEKESFERVVEGPSCWNPVHKILVA